jgi:RNA polymerase sigma-70 factor, ECF subfamily
LQRRGGDGGSAVLEACDRGVPESSVDERAFRAERSDIDAVFRAYYPEIVRYLAIRLGSVEEAQDVASDVFVAALAGLPRLRWRRRPVLAWLYRVAANMASDRLRAREHRRSGERRAATEANAVAQPPPVEDRDAIRRALGRLSPDHQLVVHLRLVEGRSFAELARITGRSAGACQMTMLRAGRALRAALEEEGFGVD